MRTIAERAYYFLCLQAGRLIRSARYSGVTLAERDGAGEVRKRRRFHAPLLVLASGPVFRALGAGWRVLPHREWVAREQRLYRQLQRAAVREEDGTLVLPMLPGVSLASLLDDPKMKGVDRRRAIGLAVSALAGLHREGITHGDAMADNVLVDLDADAAHWLDFETLHDSRRSEAWRRADDLRSLLATCLLRTPEVEGEAVLACLVDAYGDPVIERHLAERFTTILQAPLACHLGQAPLPWLRFRAIARWLQARALQRGADRGVGS